MNATSVAFLQPDVVAAIGAEIRRLQNPDGGWPYFSGKTSRLEPTAWAFIACQDASIRDGCARRLFEWQRSPGLIAESADWPFNYAFNSLAVLALLACAPGSMSPPFVRLMAALTQGMGRPLRNRRDLTQDNHLIGWSWVPDTFSWLEPTAMALLALKKMKQMRGGLSGLARGRVEQGEALLFDRACASGGWNYGNPTVHGKDLVAYVPTTALALLALQDRREHKAVAAGLDFLLQQRAKEQSGLALALTSICLRVYEVPNEEVNRTLVQQWERTRFLGNCATMAVACYAMTADEHNAAAVRF